MWVIFTSDNQRITVCESAIVAVQVAEYLKGYAVYHEHERPVPIKPGSFA